MEWEALKEFFTKGWKLIPEAPLPFIIVFILGFLLAKLHYQRQISLLQSALGLTEQQRIRIKVDDYVKRFKLKRPAREKQYELIWLGKGMVFLHDFNTKLKHHIANTETMGDLHFSWNNIKTVTKEALDAIEDGEEINTRE